MAATRAGARSGAGPGRDVVVVLVTLLVLGVFGGVLWSVVVSPAEFTRLADGAAMGEDQVSRQFAADGWYVLIATVAGLLAGLVLTWRLTADALVTAVALVVGSLLAAVVMAVVGHVLGPGDPGKVLAAAKVGTLVPERLAVGPQPLLPLHTYLSDVGGAALVYLGWPVGALLGSLLVLLGRAPVPAGDRTSGDPLEAARRT